ncbi:isochorismate synthase MenF [Metabacillus herbersteinensis]|uniref:Isochorismate synthase MenF n=1 Tax=Metabacillus herbersteinensis TaxID=283816 RepID=A0ABV6GJY0_9BACI
MITTIDHSVKEHIQKALEVARRSNEAVIVSHISEVDAMDPLHFFNYGENLFLGERFYWSGPSTFTVVGLGNELVIETSDQTTNRFRLIENEWKRLNKQVLHSGSVSVGTGPLLFGGFSFDPIKSKSQLWNDFSEAKFFLPTIMLTNTKERSYLTVNKLIHPFDQLEDCIEHFTSYEINNLNFSHIRDCEKFNEFKLTELHKEEWLNAIVKAKEQIHAKQIDKVVLAREVHLLFNEKVDTYSVIDSLQKNQPTSYIFAFENGIQSFIGATPERLVKKENHKVFSTCLAGSIKRGISVEEDKLLGHQLLTDDKNLLEHDIVVKMIKKALEDCCYDVVTPDKPKLMKTKNIQHLYTPVEGFAREDHSLLSMVERLHPTPALGGYPKHAAIEKIRELEPMHRGWYAGPIGWLDAYDNGEFGVAIRSGLIEGNKVALFAGCGIVGESVPELEYVETQIKLKPMMTALGGIKA